MAAIPAGLRQLPHRMPVRVPAMFTGGLSRVSGLGTPLTGLGWMLAGVAAVTWYAGSRLGWHELMIVAAGSLLAVVVGLVATMRRPAVDASVSLTRERVVVGDTAVGRVATHNPRTRRASGVRLEVPVGRGRATFDSPALAGGESWDEPFTIPTEQRQVIDVGPAAAVTGDPLGVARRERRTGEATTLYVHPRTAPLPGVASGWLRDLEGRTTQDLSTSDVAFHTLREYAPGDDRRHVHWRSTAKLGKLMVRQFVDTRRSHLGVLLSADAAEWADQDEFEFAVEVAASLGRAVLQDGQEVSALVGGERLASNSTTRLLDDFAGVDPVDDGPGIDRVVRHASRHMTDASIVVLVVGRTMDRTHLRRMVNRFSLDTRCAVIVCDRDVSIRRARLGRLTMIDIADLTDLQRVLTRGIAA